MADWILKGRYLMGDVIGSGGMAMVYKASRLDTGETVAIKMLRPEYMEDASYVRQFRKEAQICIEHHHRNIVDTLEIGEEEGRLFIVMEYVAGQTLKDYIQKHHVLSHEQVVDIGVEICDALYYAHCHQLVHRDIKPQNIMLTTNHTAKVADFGIARSAALSTITMGGDKVMGSVHYFSPEQARGGYTDRKTDLYSLGIVLYEMATGQLPFQGDTAVAVAIKQLQEKPVPPSQINPRICKSLEDIILKAIEKDPQCRYDSAREMANDLMKSLRNPDGDFVKKIPPPQRDEGETVRMPKVRSGPIGNRERTPERASHESNTAPRVKPRQRRGMSPGSIVLISFLVLLLVVLAVGAAYLLGRMQDEQASVRVVPDVIGKTSNEAQLIFDREQLIVVSQEEYSDQQPAGRVIRCEPGVGTSVNTSTTITMFVSKGTQKLTVPDLDGMSLEDATERLRQEGLEIGDVRQSSAPDKPDNQVVQQDPVDGTQVDKGSKVDVWISKNPQSPTTTQPERLAMDNYIGQKEQDVLIALEARGLIAGQITRMESNEPVGTIIQQDPVEGTPVAEGDQVKLWISKGLSDSTTTAPAAGGEWGESVAVTVPEPSARVRIQLLAGDQAHILIDEVHEAGVYSYHIRPDEDYTGQQTAIVWLDDVEVQRVVIAS